VKVARVPCLEGAALLAAAGVSLADAQWLFAVQRASEGPQDQARIAAIRGKVSTFLAANATPARARRIG